MDVRRTRSATAPRRARPASSASSGTPLAPEPASPLPPLASAAVPRATYRVQLHAGLRFADVRALVPYLHALGISHLYTSPYLQASVGSTHGYDVVDHSALNAEIGSATDFDALCAALRAHGMAQIVDVVPNHMGVLQAGNAWWNDVLEHGEASPHADTFDIDWTASAAGMPGRVLLPVLGDQYGVVLEAGELELAFDAAEGRFALRYFEHRFPIDPRDYARILRAAPWPGDDAGAPGAAEARALVEVCARLPARQNTDAAARARRRRATAPLARRLAALHAGSATAAAWIERCIAAFAGTPGDARSFDALDALIARQPWRLAHWRVAGDEVNYRRFFDVASLAALRIEHDAVFEATHRTLLGWLAEGRVAGLRIDHPDGLAYPRRYFERLQRRWRDVQPAGEAPRALYVVIEKILAEHEHWPPSWPVHGDTGYRWANQAVGLFVDARSEAAFDRLVADFVGRTVDFDAELVDAKRAVIATALAADLHLLTEAIYRLAQSDRRTCDFTRNGLRTALAEFAVAMPVYRSYIDGGPVHAVDRAHLDWAAAAAQRLGVAEPTTIDFVHATLLGVADEADAARRAAMLAFALRLQQFTAPVMAKAMEDTAFYRHHRLLALNDVGGDPRVFGTSVAAFHNANQARERFLPHTLLAGTTHDSKRSADVRARLAVLSEAPQAWALALERWRALAERQRRDDGGTALDRNDLLLLQQTLVGVWPPARVDAAGLAALRERVQAYLRKALREAKQRTSWVRPDEAYEALAARTVDGLLGQLEPNPFLTDFTAFVDAIAPFGCCNALAMLALEHTAPGVPDTYQGDECWNFALVDPDNRRSVDFDRLRAHLDALQPLVDADGAPVDGAVESLWQARADGRIKLFVTWRLLQLRAARAALFERGHYRPLAADGLAAEHVVAFAREHAGGCVVTVAARLAWTLVGGDAEALFGPAWRAAWGDAALELPRAGRWRDALSGRRVVATADAGGVPRVALSDLLAVLPAAVLVDGD